MGKSFGLRVVLLIYSSIVKSGSDFLNFITLALVLYSLLVSISLSLTGSKLYFSANNLYKFCVLSDKFSKGNCFGNLISSLVLSKNCSKVNSGFFFFAERYLIFSVCNLDLIDSMSV